VGTVGVHLYAVFFKWWWLVTVILFGIDMMLEWLWPNYRSWVSQTFPAGTRRKMFWGTLLVFVFLSEFLAWRDEYNKVDEKQTEIDRQASELRTASGAKQEVEQLRGEVAELRKKARGRHLSKEEEGELIRSLSILGPHGVIVDHENGDAEAHSFAEELVVMFNAIPGWKAQGSNFTTILGPRETGVFIIVTDQGEIPQAVAIVMASLKRQDIAFILKRMTPTSENHLGPLIFKMFVRSRPE
jgi:hypothetical protein